MYVYVNRGVCWCGCRHMLSQSFINGRLLTECHAEIVISLSLTVLIIVFFCSIFVLVLLHCLFHAFVVIVY